MLKYTGEDMMLSVSEYITAGQIESNLPNNSTAPYPSVMEGGHLEGTIQMQTNGPAGLMHEKAAIDLI